MVKDAVLNSSFLCLSSFGSITVMLFFSENRLKLDVSFISTLRNYINFVRPRIMKH